ncbi:hypothetical protein [Pseudoramibacter alactolyticus]|uniref:hypothetical protein n=1 Tax=Pseudoramibacter alactolyticus TaxID=113287 RepID=UPI0028F164B1|nr:hypothetical protein [Pseudoramibacter alactolyticus]
MLSADACSYIFTSEQIKPLFVHLAERFAGGSISFDAENQKGVKSNKIIRKSGNTDSLAVLAVDNAALMFAPWTNNFEKATTFANPPEKVGNERKIAFFTKIMLKMAFKMGFLKFVENSFV